MSSIDFKNLKIATQMWIGGSALLVIFATIIVVSYFQLKEISDISYRISSVRTPTVNASNQLKVSVNQVLANLRGWMLLKDESFKEIRHKAWGNIDKTVHKLEVLSKKWTDKKNIKRLEKIKILLNNFKITQDDIEFIAWEKENLAATNLFFDRAVPLTEIIFEKVTKMIEEEKQLEATSQRKALLALMSDFRGSMAYSLSYIPSFLETGDQQYQDKFKKYWLDNESYFNELIKNKTLFNPKQISAFYRLGKARQKFVQVQERIIALRKREDWNLANFHLKSSGAPLGRRLIGLLDVLTEHQNQLLKQDSLMSDHLLSELLQLLVGLFVLAAIVSAVIIVIISHRISRPINQAVRMAEQVALGRFDITSTTTTTYETQRLLDALQRMANNLNEKVMQLKSSQEAAELSRLKAEEANQEKSRFLANMSHELRTPMHAILSFTKILLKRTDEEKSVKFLNNISTSSKRLMGLLDNLLDLSKLESGKTEVNFSLQNLTRLIQDCVAETQSLINDKGIDVDFDATTVVEGVFDRTLIHQVVINLLSNAIKFSPDQGRILIELEKIDRTLKNKSKMVLHFSIKDQGIGIPVSELDTIFDKFTQSSKTMTKAGGTGLGLPISNEIIAMHQGVIWAESPVTDVAFMKASGQSGSVFHFCIPVEQEALS